jgi:hypothetical protein
MLEDPRELLARAELPLNPPPPPLPLLRLEVLGELPLEPRVAEPDELPRFMLEPCDPPRPSAPPLAWRVCAFA